MFILGILLQMYELNSHTDDTLVLFRALVTHLDGSIILSYNTILLVGDNTRDMVSSQLSRIASQ